MEKELTIQDCADIMAFIAGASAAATQASGN
jgi:hypothetical protein